MGRSFTIIGALATVIGLAVVVWSAVAIAGDDAYRKAELAASRNAGNAMYEMEFGAARIRRGFQIYALGGGALLTLNGISLLGVGSVAARVRRR